MRIEEVPDSLTRIPRPLQSEMDSYSIHIFDLNFFFHGLSPEEIEKSTMDHWLFQWFVTADGCNTPIEVASFLLFRNLMVIAQTLDSVDTKNAN